VPPTASNGHTPGHYRVDPKGKMTLRRAGMHHLHTGTPTPGDICDQAQANGLLVEAIVPPLSRVSARAFGWLSPRRTFKRTSRELQPGSREPWRRCSERGDVVNGDWSRKAAQSGNRSDRAS
jgi:hypothetical protein